MGRLNLNTDVFLYLGTDGYQYSENCIVAHSKNRNNLLREWKLNWNIIL